MISKVRYSMQFPILHLQESALFYGTAQEISKTVQSARDFWEVREMFDTFGGNDVLSIYGAGVSWVPWWHCVR